MRRRDLQIKALLTEAVYKSKMWQEMRIYIEDMSASKVIEHHNTDFIKVWSHSTNIITWGYKWHSNQYKQDGRNILYMENGFMHQKAGVYVDDNGYYCDSSLLNNLLDGDRDLLDRHHTRYYGTGYLSCPYDPAGPLLVCLQMNEDGPLRNYYPAAVGLPNRVRCFIDSVKKHAPCELLLRAHPKEKIHNKLVHGLPVDDSPSWLEAVKRCRGIVTVNSTVAVEAIGLGIPVATMGRGIFEGYTLNCIDASSLQLFDLYAPRDPADLLTTILRNQQSYDSFVAIDAVDRFVMRVVCKG